jgi:nucleoside-diphosphate-sugar epimerase
MQNKLIKRFEGTRPGDQLHTASVCRKANLDLGWTPRTSIEEGLRRQIEWAIQAGSQ